MMNTGNLAGKTIFITGASRGIGRAIALKAAKDGANIVIAAKTKDPHPKLPGTIFTTAKEVEDVGGKAYPCVVDVRDESQVKSAVDGAVKKFGGIDILVNNASAISLTGTLDTEMKRYDLMHNINTRGTFLVSKICLPYIKKSSNGHIMNISPPLNMAPHWFKNHVAYTMAKYGMSMCVLGMAEEFRSDGVAVNALWPRTAIHTAAIEMLTGADSANHSRKPEIMADAAYIIMCKDAKKFTGKFLIDDEVLLEAGLTESQIDQYSCVPGNKELLPDFFLDPPATNPMKQSVRSFSTSAIRRADASKPEGGVEGIFHAIKGRLNPDLVNSTQAVFQFNLKAGDKEESYFIDLKNGEGSAGKGAPSDAPDATLSMSNENFQKMFDGKLKATSAYMMGKLKISGNLQKAMKLEKLLGSLKAKL